MRFPEDLAWVVLGLPLLAAVGITLFTLRDGRRSAQWSISAIVLSGVASLVLFGWLRDQPATEATPWPWLSLGNFNVEMGLRLDGLSLLMTLVVTAVASAIHIYSFGYMREDPGLGRFRLRRRQGFDLEETGLRRQGHDA